MTYKIAILGDFNPYYSTHHALNDSIRQVQKSFLEDIQFDWISTEVFNFRTIFQDLYCGLWIAPGYQHKVPMFLPLHKEINSKADFITALFLFNHTRLSAGYICYTIPHFVSISEISN